LPFFGVLEEGLWKKRKGVVINDDVGDKTTVLQRGYSATTREIKDI
jgi:hypothetical protein